MRWLDLLEIMSSRPLQAVQVTSTHKWGNIDIAA